jgi:ABC-type multidrug transport system fused ATPase/permease subunit
MARPTASDQELAEAAERARLLPWIRSLPDSLDTRVGARGMAISGGERQRLALARALLADPAVLILDEPTASLPPDMQAEVMADLLTTTADKATLLITHDLGCLDDMDEIVVLDRGRAVERGRHRELLRASGPYRHLWNVSRTH